MGDQCRFVCLLWWKSRRVAIATRIVAEEPFREELDLAFGSARARRLAAEATRTPCSAIGWPNLYGEPRVETWPTAFLGVVRRNVANSRVFSYL